MEGWEDRRDAEYIADRVQFYCPWRRGEIAPAPGDAVRAREMHRAAMQSVYYVDLTRLLAYFPPEMRIRFVPGDTLLNPVLPSLIKARRLNGEREGNAVLLPLNCLRHFPRPVDAVPFAQKEPKMIFRGKVVGKPERIRIFEQFFGHPQLDMADTSRIPVRAEWGGAKISIPAHFNYRYVLALEGNDVATCLGWVMGSGCIPVMRRPAAEHWLMHSRLRAGEHYIEVKPDFSDLGDKIEYYNTHEGEAREISEASSRWYAQFGDARRELLVSLLTMRRYFEATGQL